MPPSAISPAAHSLKSDRFKGCSNIADYEVISKLGEGTFGEVHKARSLASGKLVALKKILMHNEKDGFPITALREIKLLKTLSHVNILTLTSMAVERADTTIKASSRKKAIMYMVTPYMDHDLSGLLENPEVKMSEAQIKCYMLQVLDGVKFLHNSHILHRDMKAANLLINNRGILQIADFGLARYFDEPPPRPGHGCEEAKRDYTGLVVTRWYRAPELLLGLRRYTCAIDMWGVGCVFGEFFKKRPILSGKSDLNQAQIIFELVGAPTEETMPGWSELPGCEGVKAFEQTTGNIQQQFREMAPQGLALLSQLLKLNWRKRINAHDALRHPYFTTEPLPARPGELPTYNDSHELDRKRFRDQKAAPPPAPAGGAVGMGPEGEWQPCANGGPRRDYRKDDWSRDNRGPPPRRPDDRMRRDDRALPYDSRRPPPIPPAGAGPPVTDRRPGWTRPPVDSLPARPPGPGAPPARDSPQNGAQQHIYRNRRGEDVDSYRPGKDERDRDGPPRDYRERDLPPRDDRFDRDRDRDRDRARRPYDDRSRGPYDDRDRDRDRDRRDGHGLLYGGSSTGSGRSRPDERDYRRTRSRSPDRRERERDRDRDRDPYSRRG